jgi:Flp pilus assembly protein TadG
VLLRSDYVGSVQVKLQMNPTKIPTSMAVRLRLMTQRDEGSATIEFAIVFPLLLVLFIGTAELGRLFYTYTTLAKATAVGARYLSTSRNAVNGTTTEKANAKTEAKNLVICGIKSSAADACTGQTKVVDGLSIANVKICDNFSTPCTPALSGGTTKYFRVEIQNYNFAPGVWNVASKTGEENTTFYFSLQPGTEARNMQ